MSMMRCDGCSRLVDTDETPDSLYIAGKDCLCEWCVERGLESGEIKPEDLPEWLR